MNYKPMFMFNNN